MDLQHKTNERFINSCFSSSGACRSALQTAGGTSVRVTRIAAKCLILVLFLLVVSEAKAQQPKQNFYLLNETGTDIVAVYVSPHGWTKWGTSWGGIPSGGSILLDFSGKGYTGCDFDIRVDLKTGQTWNSTAGSNLCEIRYT